AVEPPVSRGASLADQLLRAVGATGSIASGISAAANRQAAEIREERVEFESLHRGEASTLAQAELPELLDQIANREVVLDGERAERAAGRWVAERVEGQVGAFAKQYRHIAVPRIAAAFVAQERGIKDENNQGIAQSLQDASINAATNRDIIRAAHDAQALL